MIRPWLTCQEAARARDDVTHVLTYFCGIRVGAINTAHNIREATATRGRGTAAARRGGRTGRAPVSQLPPGNVLGADGARLSPRFRSASDQLARRSAERYAILERISHHRVLVVAAGCALPRSTYRQSRQHGH